MRLAPAYLAAALLAAPAALAQDMSVLRDCAQTRIGMPGCDADALADNLGQLGAGDVKVFGRYGMESFAILTALRYGASAIYFETQGEGCIAEEERSAAVEIWSLWVRLPGDVPQAVAERFALFDGVMDGIVNMEVGC